MAIYIINLIVTLSYQNDRSEKKYLSSFEFGISFHLSHARQGHGRINCVRKDFNQTHSCENLKLVLLDLFDRLSSAHHHLAGK